MVRQRRSVSFDLVAIPKAAEKPKAPPQAEHPKPEPKPRVAAAAKPAVPPALRTPRPSPPEPPPEPAAAPSFDAAVEPPETPYDPPPAATEEIPEAGAQKSPAVQVSVPRYDLNPPPHYPPVARRRNYHGTVMLDVRVTADGRVAQVRIARSSGYAILDKSAVRSVKEWLFTPARKGGRTVAMWVQVPIRYKLQ
jgi:protein TonB